MDYHVIGYKNMAENRLGYILIFIHLLVFWDHGKNKEKAIFSAYLQDFVLTWYLKMRYNSRSFFIFAPAFLFLLPSLRKKQGFLC